MPDFIYKEIPIEVNRQLSVYEVTHSNEYLLVWGINRATK